MSDGFRLALIGAGNMGEALLRGVLERGLLRPDQVTAAERLGARADEVRSRYGIAVHATAAEAAAGAEVVVLATKPQDVASAAQAIQEKAGGALVVSVCAGVTLGHLAELLGPDAALVRVMPNTPALIGMGASVYCANPKVSAGDRQRVEALLEALGEVHVVDKEHLLDAVTGLSGSGPAYVFTFLEALADGGVLMGLPRALARALACQTVLGSAELARRSAADNGDHTAELKDRVASPGGTTIAGLRELESHGFRSAVIEAVRAATRRSQELGG